MRGAAPLVSIAQRSPPERASTWFGLTVRTSEPERFQPLVRNAEIQQGLDVTIADAFVVMLAQNFPEGESLLFAAIAVAGTQNLAAPLATAEFTFEP